MAVVSADNAVEVAILEIWRTPHELDAFVYVERLCVHTGDAVPPDADRVEVN